MFTDNPDRIDTFRKMVAEAAGRPVFLVDWRQRNSTFFNALQVQRNVMFVILTMIVLVAALNIVSGLIMLVKDKGQDIAILRTMGASQGSIMRIFLITGAAIGVVGTLAGVMVGLVICLNIGSLEQFLSWLTNTDLFPKELYFLSKLPAQIAFGGNCRGGDHGADAVVPGDALPVVAGRPPRSGRCAEVRVMDDTMNEPVRTAPFAPFEWLLSGRYLRARRREGFISVIAGFSFLGIMLGVATLIIVMAVMNGFRKELLDKILGLNGHISGAAAGIAADRLEGCRRPRQPGPGYPARRARGRRPGAGFFVFQRVGRAGARHARRRPQQPHLDCQEHQTGHAGRL